MLKILLLFVVLIAGVILGPHLVSQQKHLLIQTNNYTIETNVSALVIILLFIFFLLAIVLRISRYLWKIITFNGDWIAQHRYRIARKNTYEGLLKFIEGDYQKVEKFLIKHIKNSDQPLINYLFAAKAAEKQGDFSQVNFYLSKAKDVAGKNQLSISIPKIRAQFLNEEHKLAQDGIELLLKEAPYHPEVLRLAKSIYVSTKSYQSLLSIIPKLDKISSFTKAEIKNLREQAYIGLMKKSMDQYGSHGLKNWWYQQPKEMRQQLSLKISFINLLIESQHYKDAQKILYDELKYNLEPSLINFIPRLKSVNFQPLEELLRYYIKSNKTDALLNSVLGQLLMRRGAWQEAKQVLSIAIEQNHNSQDYALLTEVLEKLHYPIEATRIRQDALLLLESNALSGSYIFK